MNNKIILYLIGVLLLAFPVHVFGAGACCQDNGSCIIDKDEFSCSQGGGYYEGDFTVCDPNPCPQPLRPLTSVPTMNEWGMIIFVVLAGLGAVHYMRRQKRVKK